MEGVFCFAVLLVTVNAQCLGRDPLLGLGPWGFDGPYDYGFGPGFGFNSLAPPNGLTASYGGGFAVTSTSPIAPTGLTVTSENTIEGTLAVSGQLPFLGTVVTEGSFPSIGAGAVTYGCGDGAIGITAENPVSIGYGNAGVPGVPYNGRGYVPVY